MTGRPQHNLGHFLTRDTSFTRLSSNRTDSKLVGIVAAFFNNEIYCAGGYIYNNNPHEIYAYSIMNNEWRLAGYLPVICREGARNEKPHIVLTSASNAEICISSRIDTATDYTWKSDDDSLAVMVENDSNDVQGQSAAVLYVDVTNPRSKALLREGFSTYSGRLGFSTNLGVAQLKANQTETNTSGYKLRKNARRCIIMRRANPVPPTI